MTMTEIDTYGYKQLYGHKDISRHGRFRELPDIKFRSEVAEMIEKIEKGKVGDNSDENVFKT